MSQGSTIQIEKGVDDGPATERWHGPRASVSVKVVCHTCNNTWMSRLETEAQPVLTAMVLGRRINLSSPQQIVVAQWCLKTAMVFDCTRQPARRYYSQAERDYLFQVRSRDAPAVPLPKWTLIWLAAYAGRTRANCSGRKLRALAQGAAGQAAVAAHVTTIMAGSFVAQVVNVRLPPNGALLANPHPPAVKLELNVKPGPWQDLTRQAWPPHALSLDWPPAILLDDSSLLDLGDRWPH